MLAESGSGAFRRIKKAPRNNPYLRIEEEFDLRFILVSG